MQRQKVNSFDFAQKMGAYSHGYSIDSEDSVLIFTTGQIAMDKNGNVLFSRLSDDVCDKGVRNPVNDFSNGVCGRRGDDDKIVIFLIQPPGERSAFALLFLKHPAFSILLKVFHPVHAGNLISRS